MNPLARTRIALGLALVSALLLSLAVPAVWLERVVLSTDGWVATVGPLASDPAIRDSIAAQATESVLEALDTEARLDRLVPRLFDDIVPLLTESVESAVTTRIDRLVDSPTFERLWVDLNRKAHAGFLAALEGREGTVSIRDGVFTLDNRLLAESVRDALVDNGVPLVDRISLDRIEGEVVLFESQMLAAAGPVVRGLRGAANALPLLGIVIGLVALRVGPDPRRVWLWWGVAVVVLGLLPLQMVYLAQYPWVASIERLGFVSEPAARALYHIVFAGLREAERVLIAGGLIAWAASVLVGPSGLGVASSEPVMGTGLARGAAFVQRHRGALLAAGLIGGVVGLLALPQDAPMTALWWVIGLTAAWLAAMVGVEAAGAAERV